VSEMLDWVPAELRVIRTTRPKYACRTCETVAQAPAAERPIAGGLATPALLAKVLVSRYCDHTPLYRESQIFARHGVDLPRSTLAGWVGGACWWLEALHERLARNVFASDHLFADDTLRASANFMPSKRRARSVACTAACGAALSLQANRRRFARLARVAASLAVGTKHARRSDSVRAGALAWSDPLPARRPHRVGHEPRRTRDSTRFCHRHQNRRLLSN